MIRCHMCMRVRLSTRKATYWSGSASKTGASKVKANPKPTTYAAAWISAATPPIFCRSFIIYLLFSNDIDESRLRHGWLAALRGIRQGDAIIGGMPRVLAHFSRPERQGHAPATQNRR